VGKAKDNLRNTGSQGRELAFPSGGQAPRSVEMDRCPDIKVNLWKGERAGEYKRLCGMTGKTSVLLSLLVTVKEIR